MGYIDTFGGKILGGSKRSLRRLLFSASEPGFTFEPWDITTLYQDRAGTTPVTAAGQPVGLRLDKSQGLTLGSELVVNGGFATDTAGWTLPAGGSATVIGGVVTLTNVSSRARLSQFITTISGRSYQLTVSGVNLENVPAGYARVQLGVSQFPLTAGTNSLIYIATGTSTEVVLFENSATPGFFFSVDNISVRELAGNHQVALSDAKRGVYGWMPKTGKRNLLNATDTLSTQSVTVTAVAHTLAFTGTGTVTLSGVSTAGPLIGTGASNRVSLTFTPTAGSLTLTVSGSVTLAQLEVGSTATAYQRVASQYDITEAGVPTCYYVQADGVDDAYVTPTITPNTDKAQVFAGVRRLAVVGYNAIIETSASFDTNNGTVTLGTTGSWVFGSKGSLSTTSASAGVIPSTKVLTGIGDISGDIATLRVNGTQVAQSVADQGTGNYLAYPAYIYARGGTTFPFNGLDFGHAVRFGPNLDAATIARVESLIARNTPEVTL